MEEEEEEGLLKESPTEQIQGNQEFYGQSAGDDRQQRPHEPFARRQENYPRDRHRESYGRERYQPEGPMRYPRPLPDHGYDDRNSYGRPPPPYPERDRYPSYERDRYRGPPSYLPRDRFRPPMDPGYSSRDRRVSPPDLGGYGRPGPPGDELMYSHRDRRPPPDLGYPPRDRRPEEPMYPPRDRRPPLEHFAGRDRYPPGHRPPHDSGYEQARYSSSKSHDQAPHYPPERVPRTFSGDSSRYQDREPVLDHQEEHRYSSVKRPGEGHARKYSGETSKRLHGDRPVDRFQPQPEPPSRSSYDPSKPNSNFKDAKVRKPQSQTSVQPERPVSPLDPQVVELNRLRQEEFQVSLEVLKLGFEMDKATRIVDNLAGLVRNIEAEITELDKIIS